MARAAAAAAAGDARRGGVHASGRVHGDDALVLSDPQLVVVLVLGNITLFQMQGHRIHLYTHVKHDPN